MPFGDKTGPLGQGPMTGRGQGFCAGNAVPGSFNSAPGFGMGRGGGGGRGRRNRFRAAGVTAGQAPVAVAPALADRPQEIEALKAAISVLVKSLGEIQKRLEGLDAAPKSM